MKEKEEEIFLDGYEKGSTNIDFSLNKTGRKTGRISLNPQLISSRTGNYMRTSEDKSSYIKNLLCKTNTIENSVDFSLYNKIKIAEQTDITHQSVNPRKHCYSRGIDFIRPRMTRIS